MVVRRFLLCPHVSAGLASLALGLAAGAQSAKVDAGYNLLQTDATTSLAGVNFVGVPLGSYDFGGTVGTVGVGNADTILQRLGAAPGTVGGSGTTSLQIDALELETVAPVNFGGAGLNNYFVTLQSARGGPVSTGSLTVDYATAGSGTFSSSLDVFFDVRQGALNGPIVYSSSLTLSDSGNAWSQVPLPSAVLIGGVNHDLNGTGVGADFQPGAFVQQHAPGSQISVNPAVAVPEPGRASLAAAAALAAYGLFRRRER